MSNLTTQTVFVAKQSMLRAVEENPEFFRKAIHAPSEEDLAETSQKMADAEEARDALLQENKDALVTERQQREVGDGTLQQNIDGVMSLLDTEREERTETEQGLQEQIQAKAPLSHKHEWNDLTNIPDATTQNKGVTWFAGDSAETAGRAVQATDGRLKDARAPKTHQHPIGDVTDLQGALGGKSPTSHAHNNATTSAAGFMSAADKTKLDSVGITILRQATATVPVLQVGVASDLVFTFAAPFPSTTYKFTHAVLGGISIGAISVVEKSRTTSSLTLTVKNTGLATIAIGSTVIVTAFTES